MAKNKNNSGPLPVKVAAIKNAAKIGKLAVVNEDGEIALPKPLGTHVVDVLNELSGSTEPETRILADNQAATMAERMAAKAMLRAVSDDRTSSNTPIAHNALELVLDRTIGKSAQHIEVTKTERTDHVLDLTQESIRRLEAANMRIAANEAPPEGHANGT